MKNSLKKAVSVMLASAAVLALALSITSCGNSMRSALKGVYKSLLKEDSSYSELKNSYAEYLPDVRFEEKLEDEKITVSASGSEYIEGTWDFVLDGNYISFTVKNDDLMGALMFSEVASAVADHLGMDRDLINSYISGLTTLELKSADFIFEEDEAAGTYTFKLNLAAAYDMKELDQMVIDEKLLSDYDPLGDEYRSMMFTIGKISMSVNGNKGNLTLLLREYGDLDDIALKSAVNAVSYFKPSGYEKFAAGYTKLEEADRDGYKVTFQVNDEIIGDSVFDKDEKYSFMMVTFGN